MKDGLKRELHLKVSKPLVYSETMRGLCWGGGGGRGRGGRGRGRGRRVISGRQVAHSVALANTEGLNFYFQEESCNDYLSLLF